MKFASMIARYNSTIWAASESTVRAVANLLASASNGLPIARAEIQRAERDVVAPPAVGILRIHGVIGRNLSALETDCGGCDIDQVRANFDAMISDGSIGMIAMDIDSPGGTITGVPELAAHIRNSAKPVIAWTGGQMCSAAYWLANAAQYVSAAPSADVGSVGTYIAWMDSAKRMQAEGDEWVIIKAGTEKAFGFDGNLNDTARATLQDGADRAYTNFKNFVGSMRDVDDQYLQGMAYDGEKALQIGMVDANHATIFDLIKEAGNGF